MLNQIEEDHPELKPNEKTSDMAIWVMCHQVRELLAKHGYLPNSSVEE
jgi:hypothetical protein